MSDSKTKPVVAYWDIRGLGQALRYALEYAGVEYEDKRYSETNDDWVNDKKTLNAPFPNLPYYIEQDYILTESTAILRYIGNKHNIYGKDMKEKGVIDMVLGRVNDLRGQCSAFYYGSDKTRLDECKQIFVEQTLTKFAPQFDEWLSNHKYAAGEHFSIADCVVYEVFDLIYDCFGTLVPEYKNIVTYLDRFRAEPKMKSYLSSKRFKAHPANGDEAAWR